MYNNYTLLEVIGSTASNKNISRHLKYYTSTFNTCMQGKKKSCIVHDNVTISNVKETFAQKSYSYVLYTLQCYVLKVRVPKRVKAHEADPSSLLLFYTYREVKGKIDLENKEKKKYAHSTVVCVVVFYVNFQIILKFCQKNMLDLYKFNPSCFFLCISC